jgi:hypothetical protein
MRMQKLLVTAAILASSLALAAPVFTFVKDAKMNGTMATMGGKEVIELAAVPGLTLKGKNISANQATFIYVSTEKSFDKDSHTVFDFYEKALVKEGWKSAGMMGAMMGEKKPGETMAAGAMMKPVKLQEKFSFKTYSILLTANGSKDRVEVDLELK